MDKSIKDFRVMEVKIMGMIGNENPIEFSRHPSLDSAIRCVQEKRKLIRLEWENLITSGATLIEIGGKTHYALRTQDGFFKYSCWIEDNSKTIC